MKKGVELLKMSQIAREIGVIFNFWNGHVLHLNPPGFAREEENTFSDLQLGLLIQ